MFLPLKDDNPTRSFPSVTVALLTVNCAVFLYQLSLGYGYEGQELIYRLGAIPAEITGWSDTDLPNIVPPPFTLITAMFLHAGILHLAGNMLYLWIFGNNIEDILGKARFLLFYIACGVVAGVAQIASQPDSDIPMIGASGAVAGILGAYAISFPRTRILVLMFLFFFIRILYVPAIIVLGFWFIIQVLSAQGYNEGVAWYAHIGGFVAGLIGIKLLAGRRKPPRRVW